MSRRDLTEADVCMRFITPALTRAGWDLHRQVRREVSFTDGEIIVRGRMVARGRRRQADYVLFWQKDLPLAVIEAKANKHEIGKGMQQGLDYARLLDVPFVFASNGDGFVFRDATIEKAVAAEFSDAARV